MAIRSARESWPEWLTFALYASLLAFAIPAHEPWADEAQAWQIARSSSLWRMFHTNLRYEGSSGLWHLLLWILVRCHVGYNGMHWICGGIALAGIFVLLFQAPFPRNIKLLLPFTYFLAFQYAVVARNYVLFPLLIFILAAVWSKPPKHLLPIAFLLGLMANISLHAAVISGGLALVYLVDFRKYFVELSAQPAGRQRMWSAAVILLSLYALCIWTAYPPNDLWIANFTAAGTGKRAGVTVLHDALPRMIAAGLWGICQPLLFGLLVWAAIAWKMVREKRAIYLLPVGLVLVFSGLFYVEFWHAGLVVPLLIAIFWMTWPRDPVPLRSMPAYQAMALAAVLYTIVCQIGWTVYAVRYDRFHAYSPDKETAEFLAPYVHRGARIAVTALRETGVGAFHAIGIAPYFGANIFINQARPFWWWSTRNSTERDFLKVLPSLPRIAVVEFLDVRPYDPAVDLREPKVALLRKYGYTETHAFCGSRPERFGFREYNCHLIFQLPEHPISSLKTPTP